MEKGLDKLCSNTSSSCDVESLQSAVKERAFLFDRSALSSRIVEEGDVTEEDEDDEEGLCFATLQSRFENKERLFNS